MPILRTFWVPITISMGKPQAEPGQSGPLTQWVKVDVPMPEPAKVAATVPFIEVPSAISAKLPCDVKINGQTRRVAACVARALAEIAKGAKAVRLRPETRAKLVAQVPEVKLTRDADRKVMANQSWWLVA